MHSNIMDELINQLNKLNIHNEIYDESIDLICESLTKISIDQNINVKTEQITQVTNLISNIPINENQIKKLEFIGLLVSKLVKKIKHYEFADAFAIPKYIY